MYMKILLLLTFFTLHFLFFHILHFILPSFHPLLPLILCIFPSFHHLSLSFYLSTTYIPFTLKSSDFQLFIFHRLLFHVWSFFLFHLPFLTFNTSIFLPLIFLFCLFKINIPFFSHPISLFSFISDHITPLIHSPFHLPPMIRSSFQLLHFFLPSFHFFFPSWFKFFPPFTSNFSFFHHFHLPTPTCHSFVSFLSCLVLSCLVSFLSSSSQVSHFYYPCIFFLYLFHLFAVFLQKIDIMFPLPVPKIVR
jgi:hypothetical protein